MQICLCHSQNEVDSPELPLFMGDPSPNSVQDPPDDSKSASGFAAFWSELRRRKVMRVATVYAVVAWIIIQVAAATFGGFGVPEWAFRFVVLMLIVGFPVAIILAWAFELTPSGIKTTRKARDVRHPGHTSPEHNRKRTWFAIGFAATLPTVIFGTLALIFYFQARSSKSEPSIGKSIAVLPFENRSNRDEDRFFTDGVHEDLLTHIARIRDIKTISRTSVMMYRLIPKNSRTIGEELGVATLLEGGVQRSGDQVRINVKLINAKTDNHIWTNTYTRKMTAENVFAIQSEIAGAIANALKAVLTPQEKKRLEKRPTRSLAALEANFKASAVWEKRINERLQEAVGFLKEAIRLDPEYAMAHVRLAHAYLNQIYYSGLPVEEQSRKAELLIRRAIELDDQLGEAYVALGALKEKNGLIAEAEEAFKRGIELSPNSSIAYSSYGHLLHWSLSRFDEAISMLEKALDLKPDDPGIEAQLAEALTGAGRFSEARAVLERLIEREPDFSQAYYVLGSLYRDAYNRYDSAVKTYLKAHALNPANPNIPAALIWTYQRVGDFDKAAYWSERALSLTSDENDRIFFEGWHLEMSGNREEALERYRKTDITVDHYKYALYRMGEADLIAGRYDEALARYSDTFPEMFEPEPIINAWSFEHGLVVVSLLNASGKDARARTLLAALHTSMKGMARMGHTGYNYRDSILYDLQGNRQQALTALQEFIDVGGASIHAIESFQFIPMHDDPEYQRLMEKMRDELARQRANIDRMEASGELATYPHLPN